MRTGPFLNLNSAYVKNTTDFLPKAGDSCPCKARRNYYIDICIARWINLSDSLSFTEKTLTQKKRV